MVGWFWRLSRKHCFVCCRRERGCCSSQSKMSITYWPPRSRILIEHIVCAIKIHFWESYRHIGNHRQRWSHWLIGSNRYSCYCHRIIRNAASWIHWIAGLLRKFGDREFGCRAGLDIWTLWWYTEPSLLSAYPLPRVLIDPVLALPSQWIYKNWLFPTQCHAGYRSYLPSESYSIPLYYCCPLPFCFWARWPWTWWLWV